MCHEAAPGVGLATSCSKQKETTMTVDATPRVKVQVFGHKDREAGCKPSG